MDNTYADNHIPSPTVDQFGIGELELESMRKFPRFSQTYFCILGKNFEVTDSLGHTILYEEIFREQVYRFSTQSEAPLIIDCGANVGMSVLYFKWLYPKARIIALEPDPEIFTTLMKNIRTYNLTDITPLQYAAWDRKTRLFFEQDGGVGGRITSRKNTVKKIEIQAIRLSELINTNVDLLKIDIEGSEFAVLKDCEKKLGKVEHLFVEYHSHRMRPQSLDVILKIFKNAGFRYYIKEASLQEQPFINKAIRKNYFDLQLNIFGYRS